MATFGPPPPPTILTIIPEDASLRDEFLCPITRSLLADPVIYLGDGHTYEREGIEAWLRKHNTSPKTGANMNNQKQTVRNENLRRLISDLVAEGGTGLYIIPPTPTPTTTPTPSEITNTNVDGLSPDQHAAQRAKNKKFTDDSMQLALVREPVLTCRCLGPVESHWSGRSFKVRRNRGVIGGRRRPTDSNNNGYDGSANPDPTQSWMLPVGRESDREFTQFQDATVSRRHFEIVWVQNGNGNGNGKGKKEGGFNGKFYLRDLGSAGGSFIKVDKKGRKITPGTMVMVGKHQLVCLKDTVSGSNNNNNNNNNNKKPKPKLKRRETVIEKYKPNSASGEDSDESVSKKLDEASINVNESENDYHTTDDEGEEDKDNDSNDSNDSFYNGNEATNGGITLKCFAPVGTPIEDKKFVINKTDKVASLGRKASNFISFSAPARSKEEGGGGEGGEEESSNYNSNSNSNINNNEDSQQTSYVGLDSSISGNHAKIVYREEEKVEEEDGELEGEEGGFYIHDCDSTNGTWLRLSGMAEKSKLYPLDSKNEILIGTVRFQVEIEEEIVERDVKVCREED